MLEWDIREGLLAYVEQLRTDARAIYWQEMQLFAMGHGKKPPILPPIIKDG